MSQQEATAELIRQNWNSVNSKVHEAAESAGRDPQSIRVIGVSKYVDAKTTQLLCDAGCTDLGESRPQVLWDKAEKIQTCGLSGVPPRWHMIGHVQTNKLRRMLRYAPLIHSVDSERLLRAIDEEAKHQNRLVDVLLEVNISGDDHKTGLSPESVHHLLGIEQISAVRIIGLMAMAGWGTEADEAARQFQAVTSLRDELSHATGRELKELSMGMSGDFCQAIAAGATMVRIGSSLFEGVV